jgi:hypothetical protein
VYRESIENQVGWPAFKTEKGSSLAKHEVGCELTSVADNQVDWEIFIAT